MTGLGLMERVAELLAHDVPSRTIPGVCIPGTDNPMSGIMDDVGISEAVLKNTNYLIFNWAHVNNRKELVNWWHEGQSWAKRNGILIRPYQPPRRYDSRYAIPGYKLNETRRWDDHKDDQGDGTGPLKRAFYPKRDGRRPPAGDIGFHFDGSNYVPIISIFDRWRFDDAFFERLRAAYRAEKNKASENG